MYQDQQKGSRIRIKDKESRIRIKVKDHITVKDPGSGQLLATEGQYHVGSFPCALMIQSGSKLRFDDHNQKSRIRPHVTVEARTLEKLPLHVKKNSFQAFMDFTHSLLKPISVKKARFLGGIHTILKGGSNVRPPSCNT